MFDGKPTTDLLNIGALVDVSQGQYEWSDPASPDPLHYRISNPLQVVFTYEGLQRFIILCFDFDVGVPHVDMLLELPQGIADRLADMTIIAIIQFDELSAGNALMNPLGMLCLLPLAFELFVAVLTFEQVRSILSLSFPQ